MQNQPLTSTLACRNICTIATLTPEDISIKSLVIIVDMENHCMEPLKSVFKKENNTSRNGVLLFTLISNFKISLSACFYAISPARSKRSAIASPQKRMQTSIDNATHPNSEKNEKPWINSSSSSWFCIEPRPGTGEAPAFHTAGAVATALCGHGQNGRHLELRRSSGPLPWWPWWPGMIGCSQAGRAACILGLIMPSACNHWISSNAGQCNPVHHFWWYLPTMQVS